MRNRIKRLYKFISTLLGRLSPFLWIYAAYLTLRYVDKWNRFPAIKFRKYTRVKIKKDIYSRFEIKDVLVFEPWLNGNGHTVITLRNHSQLIIENEFVLGDGITIFVSHGGKLLIKGKQIESASGITANSVVMVKEYVEIGWDALIAWDTFITDCDWHGIEGKTPFQKTMIRDHVWIGVGAKILKGTLLGANSVVTTNSVVLQGEYPERVLISGNPAKITKSDIPHWRREM